MSMSRKKVLIIQPSPYGPDGRPIKKQRLHFVGLSLPLLAALSPKNWEVSLCYETIEEIPWDSEPDLVAIGTMGHATRRSIDIAQAFRRNGKTVVLGGYMASLLPEEAKKHADAVVIGDAERSWPRLLVDFESGCLQPFYHDPIEMLCTPLPRYDLVVGKSIGRFLPVQAGRGCPNCCSFCSVYCLYRGRYLRRDLDEVMRDVQAVRDIGFRQVLLLDDNIAADPEYLRQLCERMKALRMQWMSQCSLQVARNSSLLEAMAKSGCMVLSFGLESISSESLSELGKGWMHPPEYSKLLGNVLRAGIDVSTEMMIGADGDTLASISETKRFVDESGIVVPRFYILTPIPGTDFYHQMRKEGRILNDDIYDYSGTEAVHQPRNMTAEELTRAYWKLYRDVYSYGSIFRRIVLSKSLRRRPVMLLFFLAVNLYYRWQIRRGIVPNIV